MWESPMHLKLDYAPICFPFHPLIGNLSICYNAVLSKERTCIDTSC